MRKSVFAFVLAAIAVSLVALLLSAASSTKAASEAEIEAAIQDGLAWLAAERGRTVPSSRLMTWIPKFREILRSFEISDTSDN